MAGLLLRARWPGGLPAMGALLACTRCTTPGTASPSPPAPASSSSGVVAPAAAAPPAEDALVGKPAPDFTATAHEGTVVHLAALKGKPVVLYFYPKDETPGCTKEACSFRDSWTALAATGAVLVGVSADTLESHKAFAVHHGLPFLLVSDPDGAIGRAYGVPFRLFHQRQTFVIGADGTVRQVYRSVDVSTHAEQILGELRKGS